MWCLAEEERAPYLDAWTAATGNPAARERLLVLLTGGRQAGKGRGRRLTNACWQERARQAGQVLAWPAGVELLDAVAGYGELLTEVVR